MSRPKLDADLFAPQIDSPMFVRLLDVTEEMGTDPRRLCSGLSCTFEDIRRGQQISLRQAWRMIRRALRLTGRPDLGLELGSRENFNEFGLPGLAMSVASTMGEAVEIGLRFENQAGGLARTTLEFDGDRAVFVVHSRLPDESVVPFVMEEYFASVLAVIQMLVSARFQWEALEVTYPKPVHAERYQQLFGCPVRFAGTRNRASFARSWLSAPIATHSVERAAVLETLLEQRAREKALPPRLSVAVEQFLLSAVNPRLSIEQVADALQLSVRTLRRRLREDGTSFRELSERLCIEFAQRSLREQRMTVREAAERLGFSDASTFRRAFKRWVGQVPGQVGNTRQHRKLRLESIAAPEPNTMPRGKAKIP